MVEIEIDGKKVEVTEGSMVMEAAHKLGTYIPHFCYHRKLSIAANCRMCLVEVEKAPKPMPACATPVTPGMVVHTNSDKAVKAQKSVMEFLLINHPLDCPICDQGGECQLQDIAVGYGGVKSRYQEEKRVVFHKNVGPLISMEEMSRCIHCTRCVRFGQEIAGVMELGMLNRGEHSEITTFVGKTVDSELSGNMIDLCPVGALTSKPFRYSARTWELQRRKSVSPHDSLGANVTVQVKADKVMRVLPLENDAVNECWISDRDRFAYEGLNSEDRLIRPMLKQDNTWREVDWATALEYVSNGLRSIQREHGGRAVEALAAPTGTLEEFYLLQKLVRGLGSDRVDFRLRQRDFSTVPQGAPWLGISVAELGTLQRAFVIGSFLRADHPLLAARLRQACKRGLKLNVLNAVAEDLLMPVANRIVAAPSAWAGELAAVAVAIARAKGIAAPAGIDVEPTDAAKAIATSLISGERKSVLLGNSAVAHPEFGQLHALAQWIAEATGATLGFLGEANAVAAHLAGALPKNPGVAPLSSASKAVVLLHAEPEFDAADPTAARAALHGAEMVVVMSAFKSPAALEYADVLLPVAPYTETSGTRINAAGLVQGFNGVVRPLGETRPAWKVLRVLGTMLELDGFNYDSSEAVRDAVLSGGVANRLNNASSVAPVAPTRAAEGVERIADVPIYCSDAVARRAASLQATTASRVAADASIAPALATRLGVQGGDMVRIVQDGASVVMPARIDPALAENAVRVPAATPAAAALGAMFGALQIEKA